jgi:hypothetical protein
MFVHLPSYDIFYDLIDTTMEKRFNLKPFFILFREGIEVSGD